MADPGEVSGGQPEPESVPAGHGARMRALPLALAGLVGVIFALIVVLNLAREYRTPGFRFLPVVYSPVGPGDDWAHYANVAKVLAGHVPVYDPYISENRGRHNLYYLSRNLSYVLTAVGGWLFGDVVYAYAVNQFIFPALNFLLLYYLLYVLTASRWYSGAAAMLIIVLYQFLFVDPPFLRPRGIAALWQAGWVSQSVQLNEFARSPNILVTNVGLVAYMLGLHRVWKRPTRTAGIVTGILLGASGYLYALTGAVAWSVFFVLIVMAWREREIRRTLALVLLIAAVVDLGLLAALVYQRWYLGGFVADLLEGTRASFSSSARIWPLLRFTAWGVLMVVLARGADRTYLRAVLVACAGLYLGAQLFAGDYIGYRMAYRAILAIWLALSAAVSYRAFTDAAEWRARRRRADATARSFGWRRRSAVFASATLITLLLAFGATIQVTTFRATSDEFHDRTGLRDLARWLHQHARKEDVVVSLDPEVLTLLPVYSHVYTYVPIRVLGASSKEERLARLYDALAYARVPIAEFKWALERPLGTGTRRSALGDQLDRDIVLFDTVLFWDEFNRGDGRPPDWRTVTALVDGYARFLDSGQRPFRNRADFFVLPDAQFATGRLFSIDPRRLDERRLVGRAGGFVVYRL